MTDVDVVELDGAGTLAIFDEVQTVYHQAFPEYDLDDHRRRTTRQANSPGFATATVRRLGVLLGFAYGLPLRPESTWWRGLTPPAEEGFAEESGRRTFALIDLCVVPEERGLGLGRRLVTELLGTRAEERATLATAPDEVEVQRMYERWGWSKVGRVPGSPGSTEAHFDLYVIALDSAPVARSS